MHVALLTYHFLPRIGGVEVAVHSLAAALVAQGIEVSVVAPAAAAGLQLPYRLVPLPRWPGVPRRLRAWAALERLYRVRPYQILHAQMLYPAGADAVWFGRWRKVPVVLTPQGADIHVYEPLGYGLRLRPALERRIRAAVRNAAGLTVSSALMRRELALLDAAAAERALFLPNGTVVERFPVGERERLRRHFGIEPEEVVFLTVSRNSPIKGLGYLLRAVQQLGQDFPSGWRLWVAGVGTGELSAQAAQLPQVEFLGDVALEYDAAGVPVQPPRALAERFVAADVYVTAALSGGFELSCADALAAGLPLVICYTNGAQDLVQEHGVGVVVPPADERALAEALRSLLLHPAERERMRQRARQVAQGLDWSALAQRCVEFYRQLLERGDG